MNKMVLSLLFCGMLLTGCTTTAAPEIVQVKPPEQILTCKAAPPKPEREGTQKTIAIWATKMKAAWEDCFNKLKDVKAFVQDQ